MRVLDTFAALPHSIELLTAYKCFGLPGLFVAYFSAAFCQVPHMRTDAHTHRTPVCGEALSWAWGRVVSMATGTETTVHTTLFWAAVRLAHALGHSSILSLPPPPGYATHASLSATSPRCAHGHACTPAWQAITLWFNVMNHPPNPEGKVCKATNHIGGTAPNFMLALLQNVVVYGQCAIPSHPAPGSKVRMPRARGIDALVHLAPQIWPAHRRVWPPSPPRPRDAGTSPGP